MRIVTLPAQLSGLFVKKASYPGSISVAATIRGSGADALALMYGGGVAHRFAVRISSVGLYEAYR